MPEEKAPKTRPMDRVHVLDFEPLHMGYPMASMKSVLLVDFEVQVHGLEEMSKKKKPVSIIVSYSRSLDTRSAQDFGALAGIVACGPEEAMPIFCVLPLLQQAASRWAKLTI